jgi:glyoxylase-like metal-dependent hydrolase (beta-lactamase superfamily II)
MPHTLDLQFLGRAGVIATAAVPCEGGVVLVDPGPTSCLPALTRALADHGYGLGDVRALLITHIHLDHAGASGTLAQAWPGLPVYVHEIGAKHLAQPEKLLASATRLYGAEMDRLWGAFLAVPEASLRPLTGGESIRLGGRTFDVTYTPGHAVHHVSYLDAADRIAYVGDTAGILVGGYALAATPPPDIDIPRWDESLRAIAALAPASLFLTHFGVVADASAHLTRYLGVLRRSAERAREAVRAGGDEHALTEAWVRWLRADARTVVGEDAAAALEAAAPFDQIWQGLARHWRKRVEREGAAVLDAPLG